MILEVTKIINLRLNDVEYILRDRDTRQIIGIISQYEMNRHIEECTRLSNQPVTQEGE